MLRCISFAQRIVLSIERLENEYQSEELLTGIYIHTHTLTLLQRML